MMSDLQCPATIVLLTPETAAVSDMRVHRLSLLLVARHLAPSDLSYGCETKAADLADRDALLRAIAELADMYRGEQVAILAGAPVICEALHLPAPPRAAIVLAVDSDGWQFVASAAP